jgi:inosine-uridine nucleoside N-ribohydrolase/uncharacterized protein YjbK
MLVFQLNWKEHIRDDPEKGCKRAGIDFKWLVEVVAEINAYLPDDWRMTRSTNNFRINIVSNKHTVALVGYSYRTSEDRILSIIDSVHPKNYGDIYDLKESTGKKEKRINASLKKKNPPTPNLYFYRPCPPDSKIPLFARQYERIKYKKDGSPVGRQYHRIHPLTKAGLDLTHSRWVRWTINGDVMPVDTIPPDYHGKDYWEIPDLVSAGKRACAEKYIDVYNEIVKEVNVALPKAEKNDHIQYEIEYKFLVPGTGQDVNASFELIEEYIRKSSFTIQDADSKAKVQTDTYFDDDRLSLHAGGASFRVRKKEGTICATLKKRLPAEKAYSDTGLYQRIEEEAIITSDQEKELLAGQDINAFPYRLLPFIAPGCKILSSKFQLSNKRKTIILSDNDNYNRKIELCLDKISYKIEGNERRPFFEIEIESKGAHRDTIKKIADYLESNLELIPSQQSKYERGISLLKASQIPRGRKKVIIDTDCGVDDALALVLALKSPELDVLAITTVSGNVHVNNVNTNVFKVLKELNIDDPPLVAKGADKPLKIERIEAESVHGKDGLGDVDSIKMLKNAVLDKRPAWKLICDLAKENLKEVTLITIGPMTNLAVAIKNDPEGVHSLREVVSMGGVFFDVGNVAPDAEFNVRADPDAANKVVEFCRDSCVKKPVDEKGKEVALPSEPGEDDFKKVKGFVDHDPDDPDMVPLTFVGLDVTHKVVLRQSMLDKAVEAHPRNDLLKFIQEISKKYMAFYYRNEGLNGCYLHDPLTVAYVINPSFLDVKKHIIHVETTGNFTNGMIFPDDRPTTNWAWRNPAKEVIGVARDVEREGFEEFFFMRLIEEVK